MNYKEFMEGAQAATTPNKPNALPHTVAATIKGEKGQGAKLTPGIKLDPAKLGHSGRFNI